MKKRRITNKDLFLIEPYRSILQLMDRSCIQCLNRTINPSDSYKTGLIHSHFLYALMDKTILKQYQTKEEQKEIKNYFNQIFPDFDSLYDENRYPITHLKRGVIKRPQQLNEKLRYLINRGWIHSSGKPRYLKYYVTQKYFKDSFKIKEKDKIDQWDDNQYLPDIDVYSSLGNLQNIINKKGSWMLCGFSKKNLYILPEEEKSQVIEYLSKVEFYLDKIVNLKCKYPGEIPKPPGWISFYYHGI